MKRLVFFPSDPIQAYIDKGRSYKFLDEYYNPGGFFDEVICLSPWGDKRDEVISKIRYIKASPFDFARIIEKIKPDIIRGYGAYCCADWISINKVKGIPTVVSVHDTNPELIHESLSYADAVICMSRAVEDAVRKLVPNVTDNIWVMPNRIDTEVYKKTIDEDYFKSLDQRFPGKYHLLHVGRKEEQKNLDTVIKAMKYLDEDIVTVFVGQGDIEKYRQMTMDEGVSDRCFFVARVESNELPLWYSWCDCMCTPSRWEGFGYVFIEAAASEAAIVTSNIGPMNEYLTNDENAILVDDYENPEEIADAVKRVINNPEQTMAMKKNARKVGLAFEKDAVDRQEIEIYEKVISLKANDRNNDELRTGLMAKEREEERIKRHNRLIKTLHVDTAYKIYRNTVDHLRKNR